MSTDRQDDLQPRRASLGDVEQDITTCTICGNALDHTPRLGEWIAHDRCRDAVQVRVQEAEQRATRNAWRRIVRHLADVWPEDEEWAQASVFHEIQRAVR